MKNHKREDDHTFIPAVVLLIVLNCAVWSAVLRSFPLLIIGAVILILYHLI